MLVSELQVFYQNAEVQPPQNGKGTDVGYVQFTYTYRREDGSDCYGCNVYLTGNENAVLIAMISDEALDWGREIEKALSYFIPSTK